MQIPHAFAQRLVVGSLGALVIVVGTTTARRALSEVRRSGIASISPIRSGREWQLVFIGSSACIPSNLPVLRDALERILPAVRREALASGDQFSSLGVAVDWNVNKGLAFLRKIGNFHQVSVGRNWMNQEVLRLMGPKSGAPATTPTLLLITRSIEVIPGEIAVGPDSVVYRLVGVRGYPRI